MISQQLFINDNEIDLLPDESVSLSSQIFTLDNIGSHQSDFSYRFKVPKTRGNIEALQQSEQVQSESFYPYRKLRARFIRDGVEIIPNGIAIIENAEKFFSITLYAGNKDFFDAIDGKLLSDLDLSGYDFTWDLATAYGMFNATIGAKFPIIDYGYFDNTNRRVYVDEQRAAVFIYSIVDQIFAESGFTYSSGFLSSNAFYKKLLLPFTNDTVKHSQSWIDSHRIEVNVPSQTVSGFLFTTWAAGFDIIRDDQAWVTTGAWTSGVPNAYISAAEPVELKLRSTFTIVVNAWTAGASAFQIRFQSSGRLAYEHNDDLGVGTFTVSIEDTVTYDTGDHVEYLFEVENANVDVAEHRLYSEPTDYTAFGSTWNVAANLPEKMTQKELIKAIASMFNLIFSTDYVTGVVTVKQFKEIVEAIPDALDWTDKFHMAKDSMQLDYRIGNYAQQNGFNYKEDSSDTDIESDYGNGTLYIDDQTLTKSKTIITLPFAATAMVKRLDNLDVPIIRKVDDSSGDFTVKVVPRILVDDTQNITGVNLDYKDSTTTNSTKTNIPLCYFALTGKTNNLKFDDTLFNDNYLALTNVLNKGKRVSGSLKLSATDWYNLDHFIPVYLAQFGAYFYVNKISKYTGKGLPEADLIRIGKQDESLIDACYNQFYPGRQLSSDTGWTYDGTYLFTGNEFTWDATGVAANTPQTISYGSFAGLKPNNCYKLFIAFDAASSGDISMIIKVNGGEFYFATSVASGQSGVLNVGTFNCDTFSGNLLEITMNSTAGASFITVTEIIIVSCNCTDYD